MNIEIKKSTKPVKYDDAINYLKARSKLVSENKGKELIWILEHEPIFTAGTGFSQNDIIDKSINIYETNRGGKITYHGPGQLMFYFVIDLRKKKKDIRKFITVIENSIIETLREFKIECQADKKNIGIWFDNKGKLEKIAAIGVRVTKWIAYHGFCLNIDNDLDPFKKIIPCGISDKTVTNLTKISKIKFDKIDDILINKFISNLKNLNV
ncbi:lipoyl(octanoyl) transferase LipB [Candidatus Pelagibacter communis]|uniref:lipoyl(octanoyl) transferase LipB n=1 Tax=Pelagibacter ubique TaxID=198252 RepID=UPI00094D78A0|nr:lipoyl(octanoyl) transferase LipB [Candidatus Pelagibacter ubique]